LIIIATCKYQKIIFFTRSFFFQGMADKTIDGVGFNAHFVFGQKYYKKEA